MFRLGSNTCIYQTVFAHWRIFSWQSWLIAVFTLHGTSVPPVKSRVTCVHCLKILSSEQWIQCATKDINESFLLWFNVAFLWIFVLVQLQMIFLPIFLLGGINFLLTGEGLGVSENREKRSLSIKLILAILLNFRYLKGNTNCYCKSFLFNL